MFLVTFSALRSPITPLTNAGRLSRQPTMAQMDFLIAVSFPIPQVCPLSFPVSVELSGRPAYLHCKRSESSKRKGNDAAQR